ncbi:MAG: aminoglycoside phosphotransferase family protein [Clostridia bacterium]|nr:aminoglycoside phosphotransferase family protein [Clostridia bacterium]
MLNIANQFMLNSPAISIEPLGNGHINQTFLIACEDGSKYTFQKVNNNIFKDVPALMENIRLVTEMLRASDPDPRHSLELVKTLSDQKVYYHDESGYYRMYRFIDKSLCLERAGSEKEFYLSAVAFGSFQNKLSDFDASKLSETIPLFHHTPNRVKNLVKAAEEDKMGRLASVKKEYDFAMARAEEAGVMLKMLDEGKIKLRVTHNDTKLNNVLFDEETRTPICVIDLDTIMPGLAANDFGDSIRFGASTAAEDETDLDKVTVSLDLFRAYTKGFLEACGKKLTEDEIQTLPMGAKLMTYECGIRFLTDYLEGDVYFRVHRENHNLDRCRTQLKLVYDMECKWDQLQKIVNEEAAKI